MLSRFRKGIRLEGLRGLAKQEGSAPLLTLRNDGSLADRRRIWENPEADEANQRWHRDMLRSLEPVTRGYYMGETDLTASPTRARDSLTPGVWERLHIGQA